MPESPLRRSRQIALSGFSLAIGQVVVVIAQLMYGAITARILSPGAFGAFAIAVSATGVVSILLTTGLPTYLLSSRELTASSVSAAVSISIVSGGVAAGVLILGAPTWAALWNAPGSVYPMRLLSLQTVLAAPGAVQMALLRREQRSGWDAVGQTVPAVVGFACGAALAVVTRSEESLVAAPILTSVTAFAMAFLLRKHRFGLAMPAGASAILRLNRRVSTQNLFFFILTSVPIWVVSLSSSERDLGFFTRAVVIPGMASVALTLTLTRALQPYYRHITRGPQLRAALVDAAVVAATLSLPAFFGLSVLAPQVIDVWLGAGWAPSASVLSPLAVGYGLYVIFAVLSNAAEFLMLLDQVRVAQLAMVPSVAALVVVTLVTSDVMWAAWIMAAMSICGLLTLVWALAREGAIESHRVLGRLFLVALYGLFGAVAAFGGREALKMAGEHSQATQLVVGATSGAIALAAVLPWQPAWSAAVRRGIIRVT